MQTLIVLLILLAVSYIGYLLFNRKKESTVTVPEVTVPEVTVPEVTKNEYPVILEGVPSPTPELQKTEVKEKQAKQKVVKKVKAKIVKKEIAVKKERKPKDKGNDMLLS
jgi:hypothetical protein